MPRHRSPQHEPYALHPQLAADSHPLASLELCALQLLDDSNYPWLVLVPRVAGARELLGRTPPQRASRVEAISRCERVLLVVFQPHKLNVAALGNLVPQRHVHVIARFEHDPAWPAPVWGRMAARPYAPEAVVGRVRELQAALAS